MTLFHPCIRSVGPKPAKILLLGEAPGETEEQLGIPFVGYSGQELDRLLAQVGIRRSECFLTNVVFSRPPNNKFDEHFVLPKKALPPGYSLPPLSQGKYLHPDLLPELERLHSELREVRPNLIVALGAKALWAVAGTGAISSLRGTVLASQWGKVLPTYHPAFILRDWSSRPIVLGDLAKAAREAEFPEIRRPERWIIIDPTLEEVLAVEQDCLSTRLLGVDVETRGGTITELSFAWSPSEAIVIPFFDSRQPEGSYWSFEDERTVRRMVGRVLASPVTKILQNGMYDIQYFLREGFRLCNFNEDTLLQHHALLPEMPKSLGFLGAAYTDEPAWKMMRKQSKTETTKRED